MALEEKVNTFGTQLRYHLADTTALLVESSPVFAMFEVGIAGMSDEVSINARLLGAGLAYSGVGWIYGKGRDLWRKGSGITAESSEKKQTMQDLVYTATFNLLVSPPMYLVSGERDFEKIAIGAGCAMALGAVNGVFMGYAVDVFRDLSGVKSCERKSYPDFVKRQDPKTKLVMAAGLTVLSLGLMSAVYNYVPNDVVADSVEIVD